MQKYNNICTHTKLMPMQNIQKTSHYAQIKEYPYAKMQQQFKHMQ